jgi:pimeloyl-ACP methyl ester carboxylesterase
MSDNSQNSLLARREAKLGSLDLAYLEGGQGRSLVFLHDADGVAPAMPFLELLAAQFCVVAPIHPGFSGSTIPAWMNSIDDFAHAHLELMKRLGVGKAILVGAGIGGWIAAEMATKNVDHLDRLVLIGPVGIKVGPIDKLDVPDVFAMTQEELDRRLYSKPEKWRLDATRHTDAELSVMAQNRETLALVSWEPYMHNPKLKHRLHVIDKPTLILRGDKDGIVSQSYAESFAKLIRAAQLRTIEEAGHLAHVEEPKRVVDAIVQFVGR